MKLKEITDFLDEKIPQELALNFDDVGFNNEYDCKREIKDIKIFMDLLPQDDDFNENVLYVADNNGI